MIFSRPHRFEEDISIPFTKEGKQKLVLISLIDRTRSGMQSASIITAWLYIYSSDEDEVKKVNITKEFRDSADMWIYRKRVLNDYNRTLEKDWDHQVPDEREPA